MKSLIEPMDAEALQNGAVFIDTREPSEYDAGHIEGAVNIREIFSYMSLSDKESRRSLADKFARLFGNAGLSGKEQAIVYEDAMHTGNGQSSRGYFLLKYLGYEKATVLNGGFKAWVGCGLPTTRETSSPSQRNFPINLDESIMLTKEKMLEKINNESILFLDVRDADEWYGKRSSPSGKELNLPPGRIPGAVWMEWKALIDIRHNISKFRSIPEIKRICTNLGIKQDTEIYIYCFKGSRAASTYLALEHAGFKNIKNYFSSWNEWASDSGNPIDNRII